MTRPRPEVAEVIRSCRDAFLRRYGASLTSEQRHALDDLTACRTAALGGHVLECPGCGHQEVSYNLGWQNCLDRHPAPDYSSSGGPHEGYADGPTDRPTPADL